MQKVRTVLSGRSCLQCRLREARRDCLGCLITPLESDAAIQRPRVLIGTGGRTDLVERNLEDWRTLGLQRPLADPAAIVVAINTDDLEQACISKQCDAVSLMELHDGSRFRLVAALPVKNREIVRHERFDA